MNRRSLLGIAVSFCSLSVACVPLITQPKTSITRTQNPLVAQYSLITGCNGQAMVEFGPDTSYGRSTSWYPALGPYGTAEILVAGMRAGTTYHMRSHLKCRGSSWTSPDQTFYNRSSAVDGLSGADHYAPKPIAKLNRKSGIELLNLVDTTGTTGMIQSLFTDRDGNPIWYYDTGVKQGYFPSTFKQLPNSHLIFSIAKGAIFGTILREIDLAGNTIREMDIDSLDQKMQSRGGLDFVPTGYHHDILPLPNGHLIVLVNFYKNFTGSCGLSRDYRSSRRRPCGSRSGLDPCVGLVSFRSP